MRAPLGMDWELSWRADPRAAALADRHYSRQKPGSAQFMPPAGCCVLYAKSLTGGEAVWGTSTPFARFVKHAWAGAWMCSIFRNEGAGVASDLIRQAVAASRAVILTRPRHPCDVPPLGVVTFIDRTKVKPTKVRGIEVYGWTFRQAGFREVGETDAGLLALQLLPEDCPEPISPHLHNGHYYLPRAA